MSFSILKLSGRRGVGHHARKASGVEDAFLAVEIPAAVLLRLKPALELVGQPAHGALERLELLVEIGAKAFELLRFGKVLGLDFLVIGR